MMTAYEYVFTALVWAVTVRSIGMLLGQHYRCRPMLWCRVLCGIVLYGISVVLFVQGIRQYLQR